MPQRTSTLRSGLSRALLSAALFGAATPASKTLLISLTPAQLAGLLYLGAAVGVLPVLRRGGESGALRWASLARLLGAVVFGGVVAPLLFLSGLQLASAASVSLWLNVEIVATAVLAHLFFHDQLSALGWIGVGGAVGASVLLSGAPGGGGAAAGALVGIACVCWALDNNLTALIDGVSPAWVTFWKGLVAGVVNLALGLGAAPLSAPGATVGIALAVGALSYGASITLYVGAAQRLGAVRSQLVFASAPLFGLGLSAAVLGEPVTAVHAWVAALWMGSIALVFVGRHMHAHTHEPMGHIHLHQHDDGHHAHDHAGAQPVAAHSHWHEHDAAVHTHAHWPDLHHRHAHDPEGQ